MHGIFLGNGSSNNTIGGTTVNDRNVISGNGKFPVADLPTQGGVGVYIFGSGATDNMVLGNFIGTNAAGTAALNKSVIGVLINESHGNTVQDNVISGNRLIGLEIAGGTASGNLVQSNKIGTNAGGTTAIPNGGDGIFINNAPNNTIGGTAAGAGNRISGNGFFGIQLFGPLTSGNVIQGNIISGNRVGRILVNTNPFANQLDGAGPGQANQGQARPIFRRPDAQDRGSHDRVAIDDVRLVPFSAGRTRLRAARSRRGKAAPMRTRAVAPSHPSGPAAHSLATGPHRGGRSDPRTGFDPGKSRYVIPGAGSLSNGVEPVLLAGTHRPMTGGVNGMFRPGRPPKGTLSIRANSPLNGVGPVTG